MKNKIEFVNEKPKNKSTMRALLIILILIIAIVTINMIGELIAGYYNSKHPIIIINRIKTQEQKSEIIAESKKTYTQTEQAIAETFPEDPETMIAIARAESGMNPSAINYSNSNGSIDVGLMMINSIHGYSQEYLLDIENNLKVARIIYDTQGINAWSAYNNGKYLEFM